MTTAYVSFESIDEQLRDFSCRNPGAQSLVSITPSTKAVIAASSLNIVHSSNTVTPTTSSSLSSDLNFYPISGCSSLMTTNTNKVSSFPPKYEEEGFSKFKIDNKIWFKSGNVQPTLDYDVIFQNDTSVSWLSINTTSGDIEGEAPESGVTYDLKLKASNSSFSVEFDLKLDVIVWDETNWELWDKNLWKKSPVDEIETNELGTGLLTGTTVVIGLSVALNQLNPRSSFQNLFTVSEYYQLLLTFLLLTYEVPSSLYDILETFQAFKLDFGFIIDFIGIDFDKSVTSTGLESSNNRYSKIDFNYKSVILNFAVMIILNLVVIIIGLIIYFIYKAKGWKKQTHLHLQNKRTNPKYKMKCWQKVIVKVYTVFHFNFYVTLFLETFLFVMIWSANEVLHFGTNSTLSIVSGVCSAITIGVFLFLTIVFWVFLFKADVKQNVPGPFESLFAGLNTEKGAGRLYTTMFLMRRTQLVVSVVFITHKYVQFVCYFWVNLFHFGFICIWRPFEKSLENIVFAITDLSILTLWLFYFSMMSNGDIFSYSESEMESHGKIMWYVIMSTNWVITILLSLSSLKIVIEKVFLIDG